MNYFLALFLLVNLTFAHLPATPIGLRRSTPHKRRLDDTYVSPVAGLHRRGLVDDLLNPGDTVSSLGQSAGGLLSVLVNGAVTTLPADPAQSPPPGSSSSSDTSTSTPPPSSPSPGPSSSDPPPSSTSDSVPTSTPSPSPSSSEPCGLLGLGILCPPSSSPTPSSTDTSSLTSDPPSTTNTQSPTPTGDLCVLLGMGCPSSSSSDQPPSQTSQPPSSTDPPSSGTTGDLCILLGIGCPSSSNPVNSDIVSTQSPPASTDTVTTPPSSTPTGDLCILLGIGCPPSSTPASSDSVSTPPPQTSQPPSTTGDLCILLGIGCPSSSTPASNSPPSQTNPPPTETSQPPSTTGDLCILLGVGCPPSSTPVSDPPSSQTNQPPSTTGTLSPSATGDLCALLGIGCPSSTLVSSDIIPTLSSPAVSTQSRPLNTEQPLSSTTGDLCVLLGIGCPSSSTSGFSGPVSTPLPPVSSDLSISGSSQFPSSPSFSKSVPSQPPESSITFPSDTPRTSSLPSSSAPDPLATTPSTTSPLPPSNTQFEWLTQSSLIFSSFSQSTMGSLTLTDPDQVPTRTSFSTTGTPTAAPSVVSLPSGIPARIVPGFGSVGTGDDLNGFTLIAILFDQGLNWLTVVQNTDSPGQIFAWLPQLIQTALGIPSEQVKSFALQVFFPDDYVDVSDANKLGTVWMGYIPTSLVDTLAAQIKVRASAFYTDMSSPYSDLADHVDPSFDITTITTTTGVPGSGGSSNDSSGGTSSTSRIRENAIIGVVSALGGITLIVLGYLAYRAVQKRRELAHRRLSDPPTNPFMGEAPPNLNFDQDSIGGQRRRSFYFAEDSLREFSGYNHTNDGARFSPEQTQGLNRRPIAGNIGPPVMRENSLNF